MDLVRRLVAEARRVLKPGGFLFLEIGHDQGASAQELLQQQGLAEIRVRRIFAITTEWSGGGIRADSGRFR